MNPDIQPVPQRAYKADLQYQGEDITDSIPHRQSHPFPTPDHEKIFPLRLPTPGSDQHSDRTMAERDELEREEANGDVALEMHRTRTKEKDAEKMGEAEKEGGVVWVEFEKDDPGNPFNWSKWKKWVITILASWFTFVVAFDGSAFAVAVPGIQQDLGSSHELTLLGLSMYPIGFAVTPHILAPFSEAFGRNPVYITSLFVYFMFFIPSALARNIATVCVARFIRGAAGSTGSTMVGGTLADIWVTSERGVPMSIFSFMAFFGTGMGPVCMGYVAQNLGWRWTQWIQMINAGITFCFVVVLLKETRGSVVLSRRAAKLRKTHRDDRYKCKADEERASLLLLVKVSLTRPLYLLITEPVVMAFSLWISFAWGVMYALLEAIPLVAENIYGFNLGETGLAFFALALGSFIGTLTNPIQEALYRRNVAKRGPEARLYMSLLGGFLLFAGCFIFAFTQGRTHWIAPLIGITILMTGVYMIYLAVFNYLADAYTIYASSAIAAQSFLRNVFGAIFPLFTTQMYNGMTYQWASFLFGCIAIGLYAIPFVLLARGPEIRSRSKFAQELLKRLGDNA